MDSSGTETGFAARGHDHGQCVADALAVAEAVCARRNARLTHLRRRVFEMLWAAHKPTRAYDLLDRLRHEHDGAAPPTVYRALDFLLEHGLIHKLESLNAYIGCVQPDAPHRGQFLICDGCQSVAELDDPEIAQRVLTKASDLGFEVRHQTIEVSGMCPDCSDEHDARRRDA